MPYPIPPLIIPANPTPLTSSWLSFWTHRCASSGASITTNPKPGKESMPGMREYSNASTPQAGTTAPQVEHGMQRCHSQCTPPHPPRQPEHRTGTAHPWTPCCCLGSARRGTPARAHTGQTSPSCPAAEARNVGGKQTLADILYNIVAASTTSSQPRMSVLTRSFAMKGMPATKSCVPARGGDLRRGGDRSRSRRGEGLRRR